MGYDVFPDNLLEPQSTILDILSKCYRSNLFGYTSDPENVPNMLMKHQRKITQLIILRKRMFG